MLQKPMQPSDPPQLLLDYATPAIAQQRVRRKMLLFSTTLGLCGLAVSIAARLVSPQTIGIDVIERLAIDLLLAAFAPVITVLDWYHIGPSPWGWSLLHLGAFIQYGIYGLLLSRVRKLWWLLLGAILIQIWLASRLN